MIVRAKASLKEFGSFVKTVVDIEKKITAIGCELHIDCADELIADGSSGKDLWGANIYPEDKRIDFISMINIRPKDNNLSMEIQIPEIRSRVEVIIRDLFF